MFIFLIFVFRSLHHSKVQLFVNVLIFKYLKVLIFQRFRLPGGILSLPDLVRTPSDRVTIRFCAGGEGIGSTRVSALRLLSSFMYFSLYGLFSSVGFILRFSLSSGGMCRCLLFLRKIPVSVCTS